MTFTFFVIYYTILVFHLSLTHYQHDFAFVYIVERMIINYICSNFEAEIVKWDEHKAIFHIMYLGPYSSTILRLFLAWILSFS